MQPGVNIPLQDKHSGLLPGLDRSYLEASQNSALTIVCPQEVKNLLVVGVYRCCFLLYGSFFGPSYACGVDCVVLNVKLFSWQLYM